MRTFVLAVIFLLLSCVCGITQNYWVYSVKGSVTAKINGKSFLVNGSSPLASNAIITIPDGARLTVLDESASKMYTLRNKGIGTIPVLLHDSGNIVKDIASSYLTFVKQKATKKGEGTNYMQSSASIYRGSDDRHNSSGTISSLDYLVNACLYARSSALALDPDGLMEAADQLSAIDLSRYEFVSSAVNPESFNGHLIYDPLCMMDLSATLDSDTPFQEQITAASVPFSVTHENDENDFGAILFSYFIVPAGSTIYFNLKCVGHCEAVAISELDAPLTMTITPVCSGVNHNVGSENGACKSIFDFAAESDVIISITNNADNTAAILFAINS